MREVIIHKEPVELYKILKFEGLVASGAQAKLVIAEGLVSVNGDIDTRRRRKILHGDVIEYDNEKLAVRYQAAAAAPSPGTDH